MQHTHMHKAVTGRVEAKKLLSLVEGNRTIARTRNCQLYFFEAGLNRGNVPAPMLKSHKKVGFLPHAEDMVS